MFDDTQILVQPFKTQLLKWIGNKQRFAHEIIGRFPSDMGAYHEPFLGSGAVLSTLAPSKGFGSDAFKPLIEIFRTLKQNPEEVKDWYRERWETAHGSFKKVGYEKIKSDYNRSPNGADLLFLSRSCYGGVVRFRQADGYMSTPCGAHEPISPDSFSLRADIWSERIRGSEFYCLGYEESMRRAKRGDLIYCDPPYVHSQAILYGGQKFRLPSLMNEIERCRSRGVHVALSIDGTKKSGQLLCDIDMPNDLFKRELSVNLGRSMLRRFQMTGETLESELVSDRLLLTY